MNQNQEALDKIIAALIEGSRLTPRWHVVSSSGLPITQAQLDIAADILADLHIQACDWSWRAVEEKLNRAYQALGGKNEHTGYAYHRGEHPTQRYM